MGGLKGESQKVPSNLRPVPASYNTAPSFRVASAVTIFCRSYK
jgi:hypothetical protein